jgi:hypothetical protein
VGSAAWWDLTTPQDSGNGLVLRVAQRVMFTTALYAAFFALLLCHVAACVSLQLDGRYSIFAALGLFVSASYAHVVGSNQLASALAVFAIWLALAGAFLVLVQSGIEYSRLAGGRKS